MFCIRCIAGRCSWREGARRAVPPARTRSLLSHRPQYAPPQYSSPRSRAAFANAGTAFGQLPDPQLQGMMDSLRQPKPVALSRSSRLSRGTGFLLEDDLNFWRESLSLCVMSYRSTCYWVWFSFFLIFFHGKGFIWNHPARLSTLVHLQLCSHHFSVNTRIQVGSYNWNLRQLKPELIEQYSCSSAFIEWFKLIFWKTVSRAVRFEGFLKDVFINTHIKICVYKYCSETRAFCFRWLLLKLWMWLINLHPNEF